MKVAVVSDAASVMLGSVIQQAAIQRGFEVPYHHADAALVIVAIAIEDHDDTGLLDGFMQRQFLEGELERPFVVTSQVPPGWTRQWNSPQVFYLPHTLTRGREAEMAYAPDVLVIGCQNPDAPLPGALVKYLSAFEAPIHRVSYETAELYKLAMNYILASQIEAANTLNEVAKKVGADWQSIEDALRLEPRIGKRAYIHPGTIGGHLPRDVKTIERLRAE